MLFAVLAAVGVFLLVPRGISVGEVELQSDHMSWNTTKGTYQLKLLAKIPIYNPNYMKVMLVACTGGTTATFKLDELHRASLQRLILRCLTCILQA